MPLLGDLPLVGGLFRSENRTKNRTNLMVFLRPVVMRDAASADKLSLDRYDLIRAQQKDAQPTPSFAGADQRGAGGAAAAARALVPASGAAAAGGPARRSRDLHPTTGRRRWAPATPCPTASPRPTRCCSKTTASSWCCGRPSAPLPALSEVLRVYDVHALRTRSRRPALAQRIAVAYAGGESSAAAVVGEVESAVDLSRLMQDLPAVEDLLEAANDAPIIRMLNALLTQAAKDGASDIHIEPYERSSSVRFRVDGTLREVVQPNRALHAALISRLKIMAELDIAEKRLPQDGRISLRIGGRAIDVRVSTLPSAHGERAVLRLLDKGESKFTLESLGMSGDVLSQFDTPDAAAARHRARHRPDRLGQDDHAVRRAADASTPPPPTC